MVDGLPRAPSRVSKKCKWLVEPPCSKSNTVALGNLTSIPEWKKSRGRVTKVKISQNLWIRFTREQFSCLPEVISYPEMHSLCRFYSLSEFPCGGQIFYDTENDRTHQFPKICLRIVGSFREACRSLGKLLRSSGVPIRPSWSLIRRLGVGIYPICVPSHT